MEYKDFIRKINNSDFGSFCEIVNIKESSNNKYLHYRKIIFSQHSLLYKNIHLTNYNNSLKFLLQDIY